MSAPSHPPRSEPTSRGPAPTWRAEDTRLVDPGSPVPAHLDPAAPDRGIILADGDTEPDQVLGLKLAAGCGLVDSWIRGDDVTAVYESADGRMLRATAMWRVHGTAAPARAWELVASAQTALLETMPSVSVVSTVEGDDVRWAAVGSGPILWTPSRPASVAAILVRRRRQTVAGPTSLLVMAHPADTGGLTVLGRGPRLTIACGLFPDALEKGVLVRSRLLAAVGPTDAAGTWAERLVTVFRAAPPVLTT
ncbi:MAG: hypothetical protein ACKOTB_08710 [Planctomycetia bacterium]